MNLCFTITDKIKQQAVELGMSVEATRNLVQTYASITNNPNADPSTEELLQFKNRIRIGFSNEESINIKEETNTPQSYEGMITPDANTIFVFGSNPEGRHGAGAAKVAREKFGAVYGQGEGLQGSAYALPTKDLRTPDWARTSNNSYEVSSKGDSRFSALNAKLKQGTTLFGHDVSGRTIESVYQHGVKQGDWNTDNNSKTGVPKNKTIITGNTEDASYEQGYLPLWREWAKQNPELIEELSQKSHGKTLTDQFARTRVSQARALSDIIKDTKSYKSISPAQITENIRKMYDIARQNPTKQFKVAYTHSLNEKSLNGYTGAEMIKMFKDAGPIPSNVVFSKNWTDHWNEVQKTKQSINTAQQRLTREQAIYRLIEWQAWANQNIRFDNEEHKYYIKDKDGKEKAADYSVTQFEDVEFEPEHPEGDYSFTQEIGKSVDAITRDFFTEGVDIAKKQYPNISEDRKKEIIDSLTKLKAYLDKRFGVDNEGKPSYTVITNEFALAGKVTSEKTNGEVTIAGTMDMLIIDKDGYAHIFDMKAKNRETWAHPNGKMYNDKRNYTFQLNTYQQLLEGIIPGIKVASRQLIWFSQSYPRQIVKGKGDVQYDTNEDTGEVTVTDEKGQVQPLSSFDRWITPHLNTFNDGTLDDSTDKASIKTIEEAKSSITKVSPIDKEWSPTETYNKNTQSQMKNAVQKPDFTNVPQQAKGEAQVTIATDDAPFISPDEMQVDKSNPRAEYLAALSSAQRVFRGEWIGREFSNVVSNILNEEIQDTLDIVASLQQKEDINEQERQQLNATQSLLNILQDPDKGRQYIITEKTPSYIFDQVHKLVDKKYGSLSQKKERTEKQEYVYNQLKLALQYWNFIIDESLAVIESAESVRLSTENLISTDGDTKIDAKVSDGADESNNEENETFDDETGLRNVNGNEGWGIKLRTADPVTTLSKQVKAILGKLYMRNNDGSIATDDLGNNRLLNQEYAHAVLIAELSPYKTPDEFCKEVKEEDYDEFSDEDFEDVYDFTDTDINGKTRYWQLTALREVQKKYAWVEDVITRITDEEDGDKAMRLVSMFYSDFRKDFIPYWKQFKDKDGKWKTVRLNQKTATAAALTQAITNYEQGRKVTTNEDIKAGFDSIYGNVGEEGLSKENAEKGILSKDVLNTFQNLKAKVAISEEEFDTATESLARSLRMLGFEVTSHTIANALQVEDGAEKMADCCDQVNFILEGVKSDNKPSHLISTYKRQYESISEEIGLVTELENLQSFRSGDKTFYSYSAPNHLDALFDNLFKRVNSKAEKRAKEEFLEREFGKYNWFKKGDKWRSLWLEDIAEGHYLDKAELKELNTIADRNSRGEVENTYYTEWTPLQIKEAFIKEFFSVPSDGKTAPMAYYNFPIFANSPVCKFVKWRRYDISKDSDYNTLMRGFRQVVLQEIDRITLTKDRVNAKCREIGNFDKVGQKFCFFPELNRVENGKFYENCMAIKPEGELNDYIDSVLKDVLDRAFNAFMSKNFNKASKDELVKYLREANILDANSTEEEFKNTLRDYYLNQAFATTQIIQLCTVDIAYYKNGTDFQKRFKELYAAGTKLNTNSKYGKEYEKTVYLKDDIVTSFSYSDIKDVLNQAEKDGRINKYDKKIILAKFKDVNIADAQAYRSLRSMRSVLDMLGKWTDGMQEAMDRFKDGVWSMADFNLVWQTIKPFVYTQIEKPDGLGGIIKVPHQNKNSEFLILAMYNIIRSPINKSPMMRGLDKFMQKNDIDVIQFESAVKAGNQGKVDLTHSKDKLEKWFEKYSNIEIYVDSNETKSYAQAVLDEAKKALKNDYEEASLYSKFKKGLDALLDKDIIDQDDYNEFINDVQLDEKEVISVLNEMTIESEVDGKPVFKKEVVHEIPYKDYCIQQPTPEHLIDHEAVFGSQFRNLIISDLPDDFKITIRGKEYDKEGIKQLYQSLIVSNLIQDFRKVSKKFANIEDLQQALLQTIKDNPRYSRDMTEALQIITLDNGEKVFNIPLDNPSTTDKIQELTNSMFKSAIQKQKIKGGACIMVSSFGLMDDLHIRFNKEGDKSSGIKGIECYLPANSREFYEPFMRTDSYTDEEGKTHEYQYLDVEELKKAGLDKLIGYRIPTEDKYSMANLIVKGFLPQQNGSAIMLPADITTIAGSDFDVDKMFLMIPEFKVYEYDYKKAREDYAKMNTMFNDIFSKFKPTELIEEITSEEPDDFKLWFEENKETYKYDKPVVKKVRYDDNKSPLENSREQRNNMLIDISYAILSHPDTATKILNPGSFDKMKIAARIATISNDVYLAKKFWANQKFKGDEIAIAKAESNNEYDPEELADMLLDISKRQDLDALDDFLKKEKLELDPLSVDTFIYYHVQNMTGDALIGMYALNTTMQGKYQNTKLELKEDNYFMLNGRRIDSLHDTFTKESNRGQGERISKICANGSAASVDNVKDPVLADLMQNMETANICGFMMRAGMTLEEIGLFFSQPLVRKAVQQDGSLENLEDYIAGLTDTLNELKGSYRTENLLERDFSSRELLMNILNQPIVEKNSELIKKGTIVDGNLIEIKEEENGEVKVTRVPFNPTMLKKALAQQIEALHYMCHIRDCANDLSKATRISRADSPNGAIDRTIAGARNQVQSVTNYKIDSQKPNFHLTNTEGVPINEYFDMQNMSDQEMLDKFMQAPMPMLQAFYSLGIDFGLKAMKNYYVYTSPVVEDYTKYLYNNTKNGTLTEEQLRVFYQELVEFALTKSSLLGDDFDAKRDYYLYDYPDKFLRIMQKNPDIAQLKALKKLVVQGGDINFENAGKTTMRIREALMKDFDSLLYMDNTEAQKLAEDLFMYAYYKNGFKFGPLNYGMYFSTAFISSFPNFVNTLRTLKDIVKEQGLMQNFIQQFYANHTYGYLPYFSSKKLDKDQIFVNKDQNGNVELAVIKSLVYNIKPKVNNDNVSTGTTYPYINYDGEVFMLGQDGTPYAYYTAMPKLDDSQKGKRGVKYNANMSLSQMSLVQTDPERLKKSENSSKNNLAQSLGLTISETEPMPTIEVDNDVTEGTDLDAYEELKTKKEAEKAVTPVGEYQHTDADGDNYSAVLAFKAQQTEEALGSPNQYQDLNKYKKNKQGMCEPK